MSRDPAGPHGAARLAQRLHLPLWRELRSRHDHRALHAHPIWSHPQADADDLPVVLVGGLATTAADLEPLCTWLRRIGARPEVAPTGHGVGCGEQLTRTVCRTVQSAAEASGRSVAVIAYSRGGQFARAAAIRHPDTVGRLITLASPLTRVFAVHPLIKAHATVLGLAGTLGAPGLMRAGCLWGRCCADLRAQLTAPFPDHIPFLSLYSRRDAVVDWTSCLDPAARCLETTATHAAMPASPEVFQAIAAELTAPAHAVTRDHGARASALLL